MDPMEPLETTIIDESERKTDESGQCNLGLHDLYKAAFAGEEVAKDNEDTYETLAFADNCVEALQNVTYEVFGNENNNSVLDLDKGVAVKVEKMTMDGVTYCDSQMLHRYLQDASLSLYKNGASDNLEEPLYVAKPVTPEEEELGASPDKFGVKYDECDFNSSDSFASTESIIPKTIECPKCPKRFMFKADLMRHNRHKHSTRQKLSCQICNKEFTCHQNLIFHEKSHKKNAEFICDQCNTYFKAPALYSKHMAEVHQLPKPFKCLECDKSYGKMGELNNHKKRHRKNTSFKCEFCEESFSSQTTLTIHSQNHETPFKCTVCGKLLKTSAGLKNHLRRHSGNNSLASCNDEQKSEPATLISQAVQKKRVRRKHPCPTCSLEFKTKKALNEHTATEHKPVTHEICTQTEILELGHVNVLMDNGVVAQPVILSPVSNFTSLPIILTPSDLKPLSFTVSSPP